MEEFNSLGHGLHAQFFVQYILTAVELTQGITTASKSKVCSYQLSVRGLVTLVLFENRCGPFERIFVATRLQVVFSQCRAHGKIDMT